ncbi:MAG TPA: NAD-dependent epimerase/dehydratase family protein [Flavobacteriales bacterium]|nr:NAD-dependent epimerase/dehydratase family protein [Flavobacteriales bacterium]HPH83271.1 NAD-dependent epimerase/dehydratase family protein [Flavobacteriales bacterium]
MKVLLIGATGLTGSYVLDLLLQNERVSQVVVWGRSETGKKNPKLKEVLVDFKSPIELASFPEVDVVICCLGTTIKKAGSQEAFWKTDVDIPERLAIAAKQKNVSAFILQSSVGAAAGSSNFYLRCKGELEDKITQLNFISSASFRPSLLLGPRKEQRILEQISKGIMVSFSFFFFGPLARYKAIPAEHVARAMVQFAIHPMEGNLVFEHSEIQRLSDLL